MMMNNVIEYKGYFTKVEYSAEDNVLHGKLEGIADLVNFECESVGEVEAAFHEAVDDYIAFCADVGQVPEKVYKGVLNVRLTPQLHKMAAVAAAKEGVTLNQFISDAVGNALARA